MSLQLAACRRWLEAPLPRPPPQLRSLPQLGDLGDSYPRLDLAPEQLKEQTADAIVALSLEEAERQPLLTVWEDVHWADPSTLACSAC
jgi:predicted ATPase